MGERGEAACRSLRVLHKGAEKGKPGEVYNLASGKTWAIKALLDHLISLSTVEIQVKQDPARLRPSDIPFLCGDSTLFRSETGWEPQIPFERTLQDLLDYWRESVDRIGVTPTAI